MKVLHITTIDTGGAYKAAFRLHESMLFHGIDSQIMVRTKLNPKGQAIEAFTTPMEALISKGKNGINRICSKGMIINDIFGTDISRHPLVCDADILFLHWVNSFLSCKSVIQLSQTGKRIIWIMHDMWLFTGGCHVDGYCGRYVKRCGNCPLIAGNKEKDLSRKNFLAKMKMMKQLELTITGPSKWIVDQACKSDILMGKDIYHMPNTLNTSLYKPLDNVEELRAQYGIIGKKKVVLFGAADNGTDNENKGFRYLKEAFGYLRAEDYTLVLFGNAGEDLGLPETLEIIRAGYVSDEYKLVELYNLADVFVNPSSQESFAYTVCESMACGTPVVGFPIGGVKEQIVHQVNGYLAKYHDARELAQGIEYCIYNSDRLGQEAYYSAQRYSYSQEWYRIII